ncbi:MAG TPA: hypothetical protein PLV42_06950 [bacterium]|nr:hypothetical protein [bacterium]
MNEERMQLKGQLATEREKKRTLELRAQSHIIVIRNKISPFINVDELDTDTAQVSMNELDETVKELRAVNEKIKKLEEALNG